MRRQGPPDHLRPAGNQAIGRRLATAEAPSGFAQAPVIGVITGVRGVPPALAGEELRILVVMRLGRMSREDALMLLETVDFAGLGIDNRGDGTAAVVLDPDVYDLIIAWGQGWRPGSEPDEAGAGAPGGRGATGAPPPGGEAPAPVSGEGTQLDAADERVEQELAEADEEVTAERIATAVADVTTDFVPLLSNVKDATIALTGINPVTGEPVGLGGRVLAAVFAIPGLGNLLKYVAKGGRLVVTAVRVVGKVLRKLAQRFLRHPGALRRWFGSAVGRLGQGKARTISPEVDEMVERGILEAGEQGAARTRRPGSPPATGRAEAARRDFDRLRNDYAAHLGVGPGGQVHHAVELQVLDRYPGVFTPRELNALPNMRGIPGELAGRRQLHNSKIREVWDRHYAALDDELARLGLHPGDAGYDTVVWSWITDGRAEIDHVLGQFFSESRRAVQ